LIGSGKKSLPKNPIVRPDYWKEKGGPCPKCGWPETVEAGGQKVYPHACRHTFANFEKNGLSCTELGNRRNDLTISMHLWHRFEQRVRRLKINDFS
jgi:hypothetical protein